MFRRNPSWEQNSYTLSLYHLVDLFPIGPEDRYRGSRAQNVDLHGYATALISFFVEALSVPQNAEGQADVVHIHREARRQVDVLKEFTWQYVIHDPELGVVQMGQRAAIREVFSALLRAAEKEKLYLFPPFYHAWLSEAKTKNERVRITADCISGMTEKELMLFYRRLTGISD